MTSSLVNSNATDHSSRVGVSDRPWLFLEKSEVVLGRRQTSEARLASVWSSVRGSVRPFATGLPYLANY